MPFKLIYVMEFLNLSQMLVWVECVSCPWMASSWPNRLYLCNAVLWLTISNIDANKRVTPISLNCHRKITFKFNQLCLKLEENTSIFSSTLLLPNEALYWPYLGFFNRIWPPYMTALFDFFLGPPSFVSFHLVWPCKHH